MSLLLRLLLALAAALCVLLRGLQLFFCFDVSTGFVEDGGLLSAAIVAVTLLAAALCLLCGRRNTVRPPRGRQPFCTAAALLAAAAQFAAPVLDVLRQNAPGGLLRAAPLPRTFFALYLLLCVLGGVSLLHLAFCHATGRPLFAGARVLCLFPVLETAARALYIFIVFSPEDGVFENLLNLCALALLLGFFGALGRCFAEDGPVHAQPRLLLYGGPAAAVGLAGALPNLLLALLGRPCVQSADLPHLLAVAGLAVYALAFVLCLRLQPRRASKRAAVPAGEDSPAVPAGPAPDDEPAP